MGAQGLCADPGRRATPAAIGRQIEAMGYVLIDTISVVERAHHHILLTRFDGYRPRMPKKPLERDRKLRWEPGEKPAGERRIRFEEALDRYAEQIGAEKWTVRKGYFLAILRVSQRLCSSRPDDSNERTTMNWTELLKAEIDDVYTPTEGLMRMVEPGDLEWKPSTGENWMTVGQLLLHCTVACGFCFRGFVTGDWGMPESAKGAEDAEGGDPSPESMLPPASEMPTVGSVEQALEALARDKALAFEMVDQAGEEALHSKMVTAPWNPGVERPLGIFLHEMVEHLSIHRAQLFYYLKLMGRPVSTTTLWGIVT
jgi:hypothetical protein